MGTHTEYQIILSLCKEPCCKESNVDTTTLNTVRSRDFSMFDGSNQLL